ERVHVPRRDPHTRQRRAETGSLWPLKLEVGRSAGRLMTVPPVASATPPLPALDAAAASGPRKFVFLTDIVTPYMASVFEALADQVALTVLFCSRSGTRGAEWSFADGLQFP